ncbi:hypothetical protein WICPIJ_000763 [Wickerhamomyces pijperi]|uniref:Uncharacterized protein n=1 Tax=Wickerhamomyces pijperi TaxID=599730 RepID=A0A9P8QFZ3_WICPI|nr:hypothetical protein WICPIJ_000763 [Wickerhamomyces pijperi]
MDDDPAYMSSVSTPDLLQIATAIFLCLLANSGWNLISQYLAVSLSGKVRSYGTSVGSKMDDSEAGSVLISNGTFCSNSFV